VGLPNFAPLSGPLDFIYLAQPVQLYNTSNNNRENKLSRCGLGLRRDLWIANTESVPNPFVEMNPHQKKKVDISSLSPDEQRLFRLYGKLPSKADHLAKHLKERKYFDSGDYALSKAGKASSVDTGSVGSQHPLPENIPHLSTPGIGSISGPGINIQLGASNGAQSGSPVKESSFLNRETSIDELDNETEDKNLGSRLESRVSPPPLNDGIPIRR